DLYQGPYKQTATVSSFMMKLCLLQKHENMSNDREYCRMRGFSEVAAKRDLKYLSKNKRGSGGSVLSRYPRL
ncbi:hypothetical protein J6590_097051, partial [Homalodisca vitripennis]